MVTTSESLLTSTGQALDTLAPRSVSLCVAFSGGLDSTVLLDMLRRLRPGSVRAVHINHGLQAEAADWGRHCERIAHAMAVPCTVIRAQVETRPGESVEALARLARYGALAENLDSNETLVTAHHQEDQLETVLLALVRGSGVHGLAAMASSGTMLGMPLIRPLLDTRRAELEAYARAAGLEWVEDPSNLDTAFDRNFLRHQVLPVLQQRWPAAARGATRSARLSAAAMQLLDERAAEDLAGRYLGCCLQVSALRVLGRERRANALRWFCRHLELAVPSESQCHEALASLLVDRDDAEPLAAWPGVRIRRYRGLLYLYAEQADPARLASLAPLVWAGAFDGSELLVCAVRGRVRLVAAPGPGLASDYQAAAVELRFRSGGEKLRCRPGGPTRELKKLLQEMGVLPWMRSNIPLLYVDNQLAAVGSLWLNHDHPAVVNENGRVLDWRGYSLLQSPFSPP